MPSLPLLLLQTSTTTRRFRVSRQPFPIHPLGRGRHSNPQCLLVSSIRPTIRINPRLHLAVSFFSPRTSARSPHAYFIALFAALFSAYVASSTHLLRLLVLSPNPGSKSARPGPSVLRYWYWRFITVSRLDSFHFPLFFVLISRFYVLCWDYLSLIKG